MKSPERIAQEVIEAEYGPGTQWEEPNQYDERGLTRALAESDIDADNIETLVKKSIGEDRAQLRAVLAQSLAVPGFRPFPLATVDALLEAYEQFSGEDASVFVDSWNDYTAGLDFPCPYSPAGIHQVTDGSCDLCGDKNRG